MTRAIAVLTLAMATALAFGQQNSYLEVTRPTVSSSAAIQRRGVLQVETGYNGDFAPWDQTQELSLYYAVTNWWRIDASVPGWRSTDVGVSRRTDGLGNAGLSTKLVLVRQGKYRLLPGFAVQYAETFASAPNSALRSRNHNGTLIISQPFGNWRVKLNGSIIADCEHPSGCGLRGQGVMGTSYSITDRTVLALDIFGQSASVSAIPGAYLLTGFTYKLRYNLSLYGGFRLGLNESASRAGFTAGIAFGIGGKRPQNTP